MSKKNTPSKWTDVYPVGTKKGDEEQKLFIALARNKKWKWRSISQLAKETSLSEQRVEEILSKYHKKGMVFQSSENSSNWGYWERVPKMLPKNEDSLSKKDKKDRMSKSWDMEDDDDD